MSLSSDPPRLFEADDAPAELRSLLEQAHQDVLGDEGTGRVAAAVLAKVTPPAGPNGGSGPTSPAGSGSAAGPSAGSSALPSSAAGKVGTALLVAAIGGAGLWWATSATSDAPSPPATSVAASSAVETPAAPTVPTGEPAAGGLDQAAADAPVAATSATSSSRRAAAPTPRPTASADAPPKTDPADALEEHRLLRSARASLDGDPRRAYALTQEHKRRFPTGMLAQEREVIAIEALKRMGKSDAARSRADRFSDDYPDSPHRGRVDSAAGGKGGSKR